MPDVLYAFTALAGKRLLLPAHCTRVVEPCPMPEPSHLLLKELPLVEKIVSAICRRNGMNPDATEEFASVVKLALVDEDYAIIRAFQGRSRFSTYIAAVVRRLLIDYQRHNLGKWHDSAEAVRQGEKGIAVERAMLRDGRSAEETLEHLRKQHPDITRGEIEAIVARLPPRVRRRMVDLEEAGAVAAPTAADERVHSATGEHISRIVCAFIDDLPVEDQLLFRLRFDSDMSVAQIGRSLHLEQQGLYRRLYKHFSALREKLIRAGIDSRAVEEVIGSDSVPLNFNLKARSMRPSEPEEESEVAAPEEEPSS